MIDAVLWSAFITLFGAALFVAWPRPPAWDAATFHHLVLANLWRGEVEAVDGTLEQWKAKIAGCLPVGPKPPSGGWTEDPELLGKEYDTVARLGAGVTWDALAARDASLAAAIHRRLADVRLVWFGKPAVEIPGVEKHAVEEVDLAAVEALGASSSTRFVLATREHGAALLATLREAPGLRDRVRALLLVGARFDSAWNAEKLTQEAFDTEIDRVTPWILLREAAEGGALSEPPVPASGRKSIGIVDLGVLRPESLEERALGEALAVLIAALG